MVNFDNSVQFVNLEIPEDALQLSGLSLDFIGSVIFSTSENIEQVSLKQSLKLEANGVLIVKFDK